MTLAARMNAAMYPDADQSAMTRPITKANPAVPWGDWMFLTALVTMLARMLVL